MFLPFMSKHQQTIALTFYSLHLSFPPFSSFNSNPPKYKLNFTFKIPIPISISNISIPRRAKDHILRYLLISPKQQTKRTKKKKMRPKSQPIPNLKLLLFGVFLAFFLLFLLRSNISSSKENPSPVSRTFQSKTPNHEEANATNCSPTCGKIPRSLAQALIHYTTSTITPQQTLKEISVTAKILEKKSPCNFLVFGLGHDSLMWSSLNYGGRTIFLEEDEAWISQIRRRFPMLESYHVTYDSKVNQANNLMEVGRGPECTAISDPKFSMCQLALKGLPSEVYEIKWDLIMVDAPTGYYEEAPGRMTAIYTAGMMARNKEEGEETEVFVHDVNREVEETFSKVFLCEGYMKKQEGRLRHFTIPSHRGALERPFCPE